MTRLFQNKFDLRVIRQFLAHLLDAAAPGLDELEFLENRRQNPVADLAAAGAKLFHGQGVGQRAGAGDFQHVVIDRHLDIGPRDGIVPVNDGVDQGLPDGLQRVFPPVLTIDLADGSAQGDILLDESHTGLDGRMDRSVDGGLIEEHLLVGPFEPGAFDLGVAEKPLAGRRVGKQERGVGGKQAFGFLLEKPQVE